MATFVLVHGAWHGGSAWSRVVPERIATLVYVTAFLSGDGQALVQLADGDPTALVQPNLVVDEAAGSCLVDEHALRDAFYGECSEDDASWAAGRLVPESLAAMTSPVKIT